MTPITTAIIPVSGYGTRRLPITKAIDKCMLPVCNRPLIDYSIQDLINVGVKDFYIVISPDNTLTEKYYSTTPELAQYLEANHKSHLTPLITPPVDVNFHYIIQDRTAQVGTAIPIALALEHITPNQPVFVFMGDDFIWNPDGQSAAESMLATRQNDDDSIILGVEIPRSEVSRYGVISAKDNIMTHIVEKPTPAAAPSNLINVSKYILSPALLQTIAQYVKDHHFGPGDQEYLITDPIDSYVNSGGIIRVAPTSGEFLDGGTLQGWLHANEVVAKTLDH